MDFANQDKQLVDDWNAILTEIAGLLDVPVALIMKVNGDQIGVLNKSLNAENPYHPNEYEDYLDSGLYCETVINTKDKLCVPNALKDPNWDTNPDIKLDLIAYLGFPIKNVDDSIFGTICILDNKENQFSAKACDALISIKHMFELQLKLISHQQRDYVEEELNNQTLMAMGLAHELNTPLANCITAGSVIQDALNLMQRSLSEESLSLNSCQKHLAHLMESTALLNRNLHQLKERLDKLRTALIEPSYCSFEHCDLAELLALYAHKWTASLQEHGIVLSIDCSDFDRERILIKTTSLLEVLDQLVINAIEHAFPSQSRSIRAGTPRISIQTRYVKHHIEIEFRDNGEGLKIDNPKNIFTPFYSTKARNLTVGLGLASAKRIAVKELGGSIRLLESTEGLAFNLLIPDLSNPNHG